MHHLLAGKMISQGPTLVDHLVHNPRVGECAPDHDVRVRSARAERCHVSWRHPFTLEVLVSRTVLNGTHRADVVGGHGIPKQEQAPCFSDRSLAVFDEGRLGDVRAGLTPWISHPLIHLQRRPGVRLVVLPIHRLEHRRSNVLGYVLRDLLWSWPHVTQIHRPVGSLTDRCVLPVHVHSAGQSAGNDHRGGGEVSCLHREVDPALEVAVA
mmetsp:Transcript_19863/g.48250  ORF Transcript_19863/g.48250 Transcript_19863/m.48250 type:complete len:210 (-) Transcript_19863:1648-2277(-)